MRLLLLSNSTNYNQPYLGWCKNRISEFLKGCNSICFIPFAGVTITYSEYEEKVNDALEETGLQVSSLHNSSNPIDTINNADAIVTGGGNTFHLLKELYDRDVLEAIKNNVKNGTPYVGWSAGSNIAGSGINTSNDMPIVEPKSFVAMDLISAQINPHYTEATIQGHGGESRRQRLKEYLMTSDKPVLALPESSGIEVTDDGMMYFGSSSMKVLKSNSEDVISPNNSVLL